MRNKSKPFVVAFAGLIGIGILLFVFALSQMKVVADLRSGIENGFPLEGTYSSTGSAAESIYFDSRHSDGTMRWGLWEGSGEYLEGAVEETDDPNVYVLMDGLNRLYAIVHVSITDTTGGCIFVSFNGTDYSAYEKIANVRVRDLGSE